MGARFRAAKDNSGNVMVGTGGVWLLISPEDLWGVLAALNNMGVFYTDSLRGKTVIRLSLSEGDLKRLGTYNSRPKETTDG